MLLEGVLVYAEDDARAHIVMGVDGVERLYGQEPPTVRDRTTRG